MINGFSIMMFVFAGALALYGGLAYLTKDAGLISRACASKHIGKEYVPQIAKVLTFTAIAPAIAGCIALFGEKVAIVAVVVFVAGMVGTINLGIKLFVKLDGVEGNR